MDSLKYINDLQIFSLSSFICNLNNFIYNRLAMENKITVSRSIIVDPVFKKSLEQNYEKHKQKLKEIKDRKQENETFNIEDILKKKISAKLAHQKVKNQFDPSHNQKKAMINHIKNILERKGETFSEMKKYKNSVVENQKKEIERQNKILSEKIKEKKAQTLTKKDIKKQFAQYESQKNLIRKVWYETKTPPKQKRQKSMQKLSYDHHHMK